jgi:hypothetical protein
MMPSILSMACIACDRVLDSLHGVVMPASLVTSTALDPFLQGKHQSLSFVTAQIAAKRTQYPANIPPK